MEKQIYNALVNFDFSQSAVLCSLVDWKGSVPRRDYPVMLVLEDGTAIGTVGGGGMEHQVIEAAKSVLQTRQSILNNYDLSGTLADEASGICGGLTKVLIEPFSSAVKKFFITAFAQDGRLNKYPIMVQITDQDPAIIKRNIIDESFDLNSLPTRVQDAIATIKGNCRSRSVTVNDQHYLIQQALSRPILHIFGAGHVAKAVAELANFVELDVHVYDDRTNLATSDRFPFALGINTSAIADLPKRVHIPEVDFVLIATRGHRHDFELMRWLLTEKRSYLGLMSSQRKWQILSAALQKDGFTKAQLQAVHSPVGLDIASETVPEIAVSILSEIIHYSRTGTRTPQSLS